MKFQKVNIIGQCHVIESVRDSLNNQKISDDNQTVNSKDFFYKERGLLIYKGKPEKCSIARTSLIQNRINTGEHSMTPPPLIKHPE